MQKFTPGPWVAVRSDPAQGVDCWWLCAGAGNREKEFGTVYGGIDPHHEANARLISAAPELVEALRDVTQHLHVLSAGEVDDPSVGITGWRECHEAIDRARAALAKATGA